MARVADLRFRGEGAVLAGGPAPRSGELTLFCRPVVTAPAVVRRDGTVLAGAWLPDLVRLGELEVTATSSLQAITAAADSAARACLRTLNAPGRQRHSERKQKARPKFAHTAATKQTFTGKPQVTVFAPGFY